MSNKSKYTLLRGSHATRDGDGNLVRYKAGEDLLLTPGQAKALGARVKKADPQRVTTPAKAEPKPAVEKPVGEKPVEPAKE